MLVYLLKHISICFIIYINSYVMDNSSNKVWICRRDGKRLTCEQMLRPLDNIIRKLKTKYKGNHKIRKTVLSRLFDDGVNPEEVRRIAGYKKTSTTVNSYWFNRFSREETDKSFEKALSI